MMQLFNRKRARPTGTTDDSRRSFVWKMGAGVSGALASTAAMSADEAADAGDLARQVALLHDEQSLRRLHRSFEQAINDGVYDEVIAMFADDAEVVFNRGVFVDRDSGIQRLFAGYFPSTQTGRSMRAAPGFEIDAERLQETVDVAADRLSATAVFPYSIRIGRPIDLTTSLAAMARLHGEGVETWWEGGHYLVSYRREAVDGRWMIGRLEYATLSRADYRSGRSWARPMPEQPFSTRFPEQEYGPDALV